MASISYNESGILFAFNPNYFKVTGSTAGNPISTEISCDGFTFTDEREADSSGNCLINVSTYLQAFFDETNVQDTFDTSKMVTISVYDNGTEIIEDMEFVVIYGAMQVGETFNKQGKNLPYYPSYPQTYSFYSGSANYSVRYKKDNDAYNDYSTETEEDFGIKTIDLNDMFNVNSNPTTSAEFQVIPSGSSPLTTFDMTFDGTFHTASTSSTQLHTFRVDNRESGVFLRWLDRHGMWQYWLFHKGDEATTDATYGEQLPVMTDNGGYGSWAQRYEGKTSAKECNACAPHITEDEYDFLVQICSSPHVSVYEHGEFVPVTISSASHSWTHTNRRAKLQSLEITIVYPEISTQRL